MSEARSLILILSYLSDAVAAGISLKQSIAKIQLALEEDDPMAAVQKLRDDHKAALDAAQEVARKHIEGE